MYIYVYIYNTSSFLMKNMHPAHIASCDEIEGNSKKQVMENEK